LYYCNISIFYFVIDLDNFKKTDTVNNKDKLRKLLWYVFFAKLAPDPRAIQFLRILAIPSSQSPKVGASTHDISVL